MLDILELLRRWAVAWRTRLFSGRPIRTGPSPAYNRWRDREYGRRTLTAMDKSMRNFAAGRTSGPVDPREIGRPE
jgi:hypothetical protein